MTVSGTPTAESTVGQRIEAVIKLVNDWSIYMVPGRDADESDGRAQQFFCWSLLQWSLEASASSADICANVQQRWG
jgi:hypothetical protein